MQAVPKGCGQLGPEAGPEAFNGNIVGHFLWWGVGWQDFVLVGQSPVERGVPAVFFALATCLGREALADPLGINSLSERKGRNGRGHIFLAVSREKLQASWRRASSMSLQPLHEAGYEGGLRISGFPFPQCVCGSVNGVPYCACARGFSDCVVAGCAQSS